MNVLPNGKVSRLQAVSVAVVASMLYSCQATQPNEFTGFLRPAYGTLEELFQTEIVNIGLEELGYSVVSGSEVEYDTLHTAIANNYLDYTTVHWNPLHDQFVQNSEKGENLVSVGTLIQNATQGYSIDQATAEQYGITNLKQLQDPAIAALFDSDGNGKANLVGCPPGWGCREVIEHHLDTYDLRDTVEHDNDNYFALIDQVIADYQAGKPVLYYTWTPLWVSDTLTPGAQVEWLEVPYTALPESYADTVNTVVDGKNLGFAVNQIEIVTHRNFVENYPAATAFFEAVEIPIDAVSLQNQKMRNGENTPSDIRAHAEAWVEENRELFDSWLAAAQ